MDPGEMDKCGRCGLPERDHQYPPGTDEEGISVLAALGGPCPHFTASAATLRYQRHLAIAARPPGRGGRRGELCSRCGNRGHNAGKCPF